MAGSPQFTELDAWVKTPSPRLPDFTRQCLRTDVVLNSVSKQIERASLADSVRRGAPAMAGSLGRLIPANSQASQSQFLLKVTSECSSALDKESSALI